VHHGKFWLPMSALGQKQTSAHVRGMSALPPKADIAERDHHVRFVPDSCTATYVGQKSLYLNRSSARASSIGGTSKRYQVSNTVRLPKTESDGSARLPRILRRHQPFLANNRRAACEVVGEPLDSGFTPSLHQTASRHFATCANLGSIANGGQENNRSGQWPWKPQLAARRRRARGSPA